MKARIQLTIIVMVLVLLGGGLTMYKHFTLGFPLVPTKKEMVSTVEATITFTAEGKALTELASRCADITGLSYLRADIVLDRQRGPMILELNARPGLAIQVANGVGLRPRTDLIGKEAARGERTAAERAAFSMQTFGIRG